MNRETIETKLRAHGYGLTEATAAERADPAHYAPPRWRIYKLAADGIHGYAGGIYCATLNDVAYELEKIEERAK